MGRRVNASVDPIQAEVAARFLLAAAEEMGATLEIATWGPDWGPGLPPFEGMSAPEHLPALTAELLRRGFSEADITRVLHGNYFRVFREVLR